MKISIITVFPELFDAFIKTSIIARAIEKNIVSFQFVRMSDMCAVKERIDEPTVGPGAGMIIKPDVIEKAINTCEEQWGKGFKIFFSPQGITLNQYRLKLWVNTILGERVLKQEQDQTQPNDLVNDQSNAGEPHIILVCSRYEGIDARVESYYADLVVSIGDYVLMGGDIPAQVFLEAFLRLIPGIVGRQESVEEESFQGPFLDHPEYGLPVEWKALQIPEILRSGNHGEIAKWRQQEACKKTLLKRFDWFSRHVSQAQDIARARAHIPNHYIALMHANINLKCGGVGNTSIATIDIHDISRAGTTYGIKNFFVVTPLCDQQEIMRTFLDFWSSERGQKYNANRGYAIGHVIPVDSFDEVFNEIYQKEQKAPLIITTSAKEHSHVKKIDYCSQGEVWQHNRPVLIVLGTGQGLSDEILNRSDYLLGPLKGLPDYNHLSVRSAASIILDRWLGLQTVNY